MSLEPSHPASHHLKRLVLFLKVMHADAYWKDQTKSISIIQNASAAANELLRGALPVLKKKSLLNLLLIQLSFNQVIEHDLKKCQSECVIMCQQHVF